jgi:hypothetical protein
MYKKIRFIITTLVTTLSLVVFFGVPAMALVSTPSNVVAPTSASKTDACAGIAQLDPSQTCGSSGGTTVSGVIKTVVDILSFVVGVAAVISIILSGLKFVTSQGDVKAIESARTGIIFALIGLVIVAFAQVIVRYVLIKLSSP